MVCAVGVVAETDLAVARVGGKELTGKRTRILVADNDARVRRALRTLLGQEPGQIVIRESLDVASLGTAVDDFQPDVILLDWELPGRPAAALLFGSQKFAHQPKVIVIARRPEDRQLALAAGAAAFVSKSDSPERLLAAYRQVLGQLAKEVG
jgi:DNA-binding NarL/FixJ family response regulator